MRSVVVATYQGERYIARQLASILTQLAPEDEVVVSDDASSDRTLDIVAQLGDARTRILAHPDRVGYVANFGRALAHARGDPIYFSDQDDVWLPSKVATLDAALAIRACVASDAVVVDDALRTLHHSYFDWRGTKSFSPLAVYLKPPIVGATLACRREYVQALLPFPADIPYDFWLTLNAAWDRVLHVVQTPLILYRRHAQALSVSATGRRRSAATIATERIGIAGAMLRRRLMSRGRVAGIAAEGHDPDPDDGARGLANGNASRPTWWPK